MSDSAVDGYSKCLCCGRINSLGESCRCRLPNQPSPEVERLQKRVGELEEAAKALGSVIDHFQEIDDRGIVKVEFTREIADTLWIIRNKALSPTTTGYVGDGAPVQKTDAFGNVEDETL